MMRLNGDLNYLMMTTFKIMYRVFEGEVLALFPYQLESLGGTVTCYTHIGQHSSADYNHVIDKSRPATPEEYKDLHAELIGIYQRLQIVKRRNYNKYLQEYRSLAHRLSR